MKPVNTLLAVSVMATAMAAATAYADTNIRWQERTHNFGTFNEDLGKVSCRFTGVNEGTDTVFITETRSTCGCTVPKISTNTLAPGDTINVDVTYDADRRPGPFDKKITLVCGDAGREILTISGKVKGSARSLSANYPHKYDHFRLQNPFVGVGNIIKGHMGSAILLGINDQDYTITPVIEDLPKYINAICQPDTAAEGDNFIFSFTIDTSDSQAPFGLSVDSLRLSIKEFPEDIITIPMTYIISEDFSKLSREERRKAPMLTIDGSSIDFGRIDPTSDTPLKRDILLVNPSDTTLLLRRVYTFDKNISVSIPDDKIEPRGSMNLTVEVIPSILKDQDMLNARVNIVSNSPANHQATVRVVGEVIKPE